MRFDESRYANRFYKWRADATAERGYEVTQRMVAREVGCDVRVISELERGHPPLRRNAGLVGRLARYYEVSVEEVLGMDEASGALPSGASGERASAAGSPHPRRGRSEEDAA